MPLGTCIAPKIPTCIGLVVLEVVHSIFDFPCSFLNNAEESGRKNVEKRKYFLGQ